MLGRVHVEADVLDLLGELGIVGALEGENAVRLQPMRLPQALNGAQADADRFRHGAAGPLRRVAGGSEQVRSSTLATTLTESGARPGLRVLSQAGFAAPAQRIVLATNTGSVVAYQS
jgi:hypothetical protein